MGIKPARALAYMEDFYCPFAFIDTKELKDVSFIDHAKSSALTSAVEDAKDLPLSMNCGEENALEDKIHQTEEVALSATTVTNDQNGKNNVSQISSTGIIISSLQDDGLVSEKNASLDEIDRKVDEAIANLDVSLSDGVNAETSPQDILAVAVTFDAETNTSQPMFVDASTGNSQKKTVDCAAGNSEPWYSETTGAYSGQEMETQTEQEKNVKLDDDLKKNISKKQSTPILFPRVVGQTICPEIPMKIKRVIEDYKPHAIYNTTLKYDYDEIDKENNMPIQSKGMLDYRPNKILKLDGDFNDPHHCSDFDSSRLRICAPTCPPMRLGISKKIRVRKPLHPRTSQN